jgi:polo-like kinase 1
MQYFRKYLNGGSSTEEENLSDINGQKKVPFVYIKKWTKTEEGIIFRLNTKLIQVNFNDKTQLMIYGESGLIVYCGKNN